MSETDMLVGQGFRYLPQVFTDPEFAATVPQMEEEEEEVSNNKFIGKYCDTGTKCGETYCWCNSSDWEEGLLDLKNPNANTNPSLEKIPSHKNNIKIPAEWVQHRCRTVQAGKEYRQNIENARFISQEEFNNGNNNM